MWLPVANLGQTEVKGSKMEGHGHVLQLGIPKRTSPWKGVVSELREPVAVSDDGEALPLYARFGLTSTPLGV